jgi:hypothetical protein
MARTSARRGSPDPAEAADRRSPQNLSKPSGERVAPLSAETLDRIDRMNRMEISTAQRVGIDKEVKDAKV